MYEVSYKIFFICGHIMTTLFLVQAVTLYSLPAEVPVLAFNLAIVRVIKLMTIRWAGHVASVVGKRRAYRLQVVKPEGRTPCGKPWNKWDNNIKIVLTEILGDGVGCIKSGMGY
jgi:hypothetical protein